jgi:mono/diheme cytochrome c family protein
MTTLDPRDALPGREGKNALVGYSFNVSTNPSGIEIASPNCLACHASHLSGNLIVGLGHQRHLAGLPSGIADNPALIGMGLQTPGEFAEYQLFGERFLTSQEVGTLIAFGAQAAHRDPATLAWSSTTRFDASTGLAGWVDIPPWWRVKKLNALYASGMGRGDHVRHMMNMTIFSLDNVAAATQVDAMFANVAAFIESIQPPKYPGTTDPALVAAGERVFIANCASCHGTYGPQGSFPNLLIPVDMVGTDSYLAVKSWVNDNSAAWWAASFYGQGSRYERNAGYVAPPLDGIWATAPFLHNGSIPTLEGLLDSSKRPTTWSATFDDDTTFDDNGYDLSAVGWKSGPGETYDTTLPGYSNAGHTYGDTLSAGDRRAVLEYLKTL